MDPLRKAQLYGLAKLIVAILGGYGIAVSDTTVMELISLVITLAPIVIDWFHKQPAVNRKIRGLEAAVANARYGR